MTLPRLILHVGGAKCGSSALQTALSSQAQLTAPETPEVVYAAFHATRGLIYGEELLQIARSKSFGYASSSVAHDLQSMDPADRATAVDRLHDLMSRHDTVILSNEGWLPRYNMMNSCGFLDELGVPFDVFAVVRPQAEFVNSGWWQWGAWTNPPDLERWTFRGGKAPPQFLWHSHLRKWARHRACSGTTIRLLSRDIVGDFFDAYGLTPAPGMMTGRASNVSLPGEVLRLFQRHPDLRIGRAVIDFALGQFDLGNQPTPWVVDPDLAERLVTLARDDNQALCAMLPADQADRMRATPGWWSAEAYAGKPLESPRPQPPDPEASQRMQGQLIAALGDVTGRLSQAPAFPQEILTPLPENADADQVDARNGDLADALFKCETTRRAQDAGPWS